MIQCASFLLIMLSISLHAMEPSGQRKAYLETFILESGEVDLYASHPIDQTNLQIDRIIVAMQGHKREPESRVKAVKASAIQVNMHKRVLVISPAFKTDKDNPRATELQWSNHGWKQGNKAQNHSRMSSFAVLDEMLTSLLLSGHFPAVTQVFITGHSAGGQFTQRYALTSHIPSQFDNVEFNFLSMNPSSYTYLNELRPDPARAGQFIKPVMSACVSDYNNYKYGLDALNDYAQKAPIDIVNNFLNRKLYYFVGQLDNDPKHVDLDNSPAGQLQGTDRLARARNYFTHLSTYFPTNNHEKIEIPGVGHDGPGMYASTAAQNILFDTSQEAVIIECPVVTEIYATQTVIPDPARQSTRPQNVLSSIKQRGVQFFKRF